MDNNVLDIRDKNELISTLQQVDNIVTKKYISNLSDCEIVPISQDIKNIPINSIIRLFKVNQVVYNKNENNRDKLVNVMNAISACGGSTLVLINSDGEKIDYYIGIRSDRNNVTTCKAALSKTIVGNFPGTKLVDLKKNKIDNILNNIFETEFENNERIISAVTGISACKSEENSKDNLKFIQGIEKLIDSMKNEKYSIVLIADPINEVQQQEIRQGYEMLHSQLVPFATSNYTYGINESEAVSNSITNGVSKTITENLTKTISHTSGISKTDGSGKNNNFSFTPFGIGFSNGSSTQNSQTQSRNKSDSNAESRGSSDTTTSQKGETKSITNGDSRSLQIKFENKTIKEILKRIDMQLERLNSSQGFGLWNCSVYCISDDVQTSKIIASTFKSLTRGENSFIENGGITTWIEKKKLLGIKEYVSRLRHPILKFNHSNMTVTPASLINSNELALQAGFPQKSVNGLPVIEIAPFAREILLSEENESKSIDIGNIYHMGEKESRKVNLDVNSLASHLFITGSTGSGKSNTVYNLLEKLSSSYYSENEYIKFLVIEPAKGEYKEVFGNREDVSVYGTNPKKTKLLRINPFSFPDDVHVLEHIDYLIEIFNVCWPMYAAMPAVLKEAIERSYIVSGWDLNSSETIYSIGGKKLYPSFEDVLIQINNVLFESKYSADSKGDYIGALSTRLKSLTNGINGQVFSCDELSDEELFENNVIIDLSRVGSAETKSLIMGILIIKLQEFRMSNKEKGNNLLKHVTVLEEAHNILKKTSTEQSMEGANLIGKSVEMLANAIAEMRTYGEGFIIADQSPGLMDMSVIRNTNTKIILRLPDYNDRELVGRAANLNDEQIIELAKLPTGVAAIYQNNWFEPILAKIDRMIEEYGKEPFIQMDIKEIDLNVKQEFIKILLKSPYEESTKADLKRLNLEHRLLNAPFSTEVKILIHKFFKAQTVDDIRSIRNRAIFRIFKGDDLIESTIAFRKNIKQWYGIMYEKFGSVFEQLSTDEVHKIFAILVKEKAEREDNMQFNELFDNLMSYIEGERRKKL